jgi:transposase
MDPVSDALPDDVAALKAALIAERARSLKVVAELAVARAKASEDLALIAAQKLRIAKLERQVYGQRSERSARLIDQLALDFEELEASATEDELAAERAAALTTTVRAFTRRRAERDTFPDHLPRERVVIDPPTACACCGGKRLRKLGEDVTQTLETTPRRWKVIETVREKFSCRDCETISQTPAPFHVIPRGWAGPSLLAMIVFEKFGQHQPLNRQADRYALEGAPIALSTMADAVGAVCTALDPLRRLVEAHVMAAERLHGDDTTVPVLAKGKTDTGRFWIYLRDDQPFGGAGSPAAIFHYSRDRRGEHPQAHLAGYAGILQADAYDGYNKLYLADRKPGPIREAACWVHARRPFFAMADIEENAPQGFGEEGDPALADRYRGGAPHRRAVCHRALDQRQEPGRAPRGPTRLEPAPGRRSHDLHARAGGEAVARARPRQGDPVYAQALAGIHAVPRRRSRLHVQQRRRAWAARRRARAKIVAVLRI